MSTRKLGTYATREEFLENEIRTLNYHIQSMIDTMKVMSMNRQDMSDELARMKQEIKSAVLAEREACAKVVEAWSDWHGGTETLANAIRARGQA
jgi:phage host-nuclease inhibitor protein Gam